MPEVGRRRVIVHGLGVVLTSTMLPSAASAATVVTSGPTAPGSPTDVSATVDPTPDESGFYAIDVAWTAPADDGGSPLTLYRHELYSVAFGADIGTSTQAASSTTNQYLTDVEGDYRFTVRAENAVGLSDPTVVEFTVPPSIQVPPA